MAKYLSELQDIFVHAFFGDEYLFIPTILGGGQYELDSENYHDRQAFETIKKTHEVVRGKDCNYWISGNVLDQWQGETRQERARLFAIWYHQNKGKLPKFDLLD